ncbi:hypothetical protein GOP47_0028010 [Adiantum capillus-veneris]|nr:hypothetical protein GOP47_0028010 [Adiantum capillus-veneris]
MGGEEDSSALVTVADERAPLLSQTAFDPSMQQRWTELETVHLISAYQEKWYLLKRGQLKARHWEEVANNVFLRGGSSKPSKSSVQCRHKVEKLRKKYREEKQLEEQRGPGSSSWPFFDYMDAMERGKPISKIKFPATLGGVGAVTSGNGNSNRGSHSRSKLQDGGDKDYEPPLSMNKESRDASPLRKRGSVRVKGGSTQHPERTYIESPRVTLRPKIRKSYAMDDDHISMDEKSTFPGVNHSFSKRMKTELASIVCSLGEGFLRIEQMKLEMQRDNERLRAEVEFRRIRMLLDSQRQIAEMFTKALTGKKGVKKRQLQEL